MADRERVGSGTRDFSFPRRVRTQRQISSFLPKGNVKRVAQPRLGLRPEAEDTLTYCCRAVSRGGWGHPRCVAIHLVFSLGRRAVSVAVSLRWTFPQCVHHCGQGREGGLEEGQEGRRVPWAAAQLWALPGTGGGLGKAWSRPSGRVWFGFPGRCSGRSDRRPVMAEVRSGRRVDTVLAWEVQKASQRQ